MAGRNNSQFSILNSQFLSFVKKEFRHVLRDRKTLLILFGLPVVQILIFGFTLTNEVKNAKIMIVDNAKDVSTRHIISEISASTYFQIEDYASDNKQIEAAFKKGSIQAAIVFPADFHRELIHLKEAGVQIIADASDPNTSAAIISYLTAIIQQYQMSLDKTSAIPLRIQPQIRMLYNPQLKGAHNFVPGVMAMVLMLICVLMTAISIVKEKETGTMEILLVSPFKASYVVLAKAVPYFFLSLINVATILFLSAFVLKVPIRGSLTLLLAESTLFIISCLVLGIFISIKTKTQETAMLISLMGLLLPVAIFSGFLFPIESMPVVLQWLSHFLPSKWYYNIVCSIMIKGSGFSIIWKETLILAAMTLGLFIIALRSFKIRLS